MSKVCHLEIARTGLRERDATRAGFEYVTVTVQSGTKAGDFPGTQQMTVKMTAELGTGRLLGVQIVGYEGSAKRYSTRRPGRHPHLRQSHRRRSVWLAVRRRSRHLQRPPLRRPRHRRRHARRPRHDPPPTRRRESSDLMSPRKNEKRRAAELPDAPLLVSSRCRTITSSIFPLTPALSPNPGAACSHAPSCQTRS